MSRRRENLPVTAPKIVRPHQMAWLRRPELDEPGIEAWELPDGRLYAHDPVDGPLLLEFYRMPKGVVPE
jgi:hypothetical protein